MNLRLRDSHLDVIGERPELGEAFSGPKLVLPLSNGFFRSFERILILPFLA